MDRSALRSTIELGRAERIILNQGTPAGEERGDFAARKPAPSFSKPAKAGAPGKVFVPRDVKKRPDKPAN